MKKILLCALLPLVMLFEVSVGNIVYAQMNIVNVGTGMMSSNTLPFNMYHKYSFNQMVYYKGEIGEAGYIGALSFMKSGTTSRTIQDLTIWMALTPDSALTSTSWVPQNAMKQVFHADNYTLPSVSGEMQIQLDSLFYYDGNQNLAIIVSRKDDSYSPSIYFYYSMTGAFSCVYRRDNSNATYADYPGTATGSTSKSRPNIKLYMNSSDAFCFPLSKLNVVGVDQNSISISWPYSDDVMGYEVAIKELVDNDSTLSSFTSAVGSSHTFSSLNSNTEYLVGVRKVCGTSNYSDAITKIVRTTTIPTSLPYTCEFESNEARSNWILDNGNNTNRWVISSATHYGEESTQSMYISNDTSASLKYEYDNTKEGVVFAKCLLNFASVGEYNIQYDWNGKGDGSYDYMRVMLVPASMGDQMVAGRYLPSSFVANQIPSWAISVDGNAKLCSVDGWQHFMDAVEIPNAGNYYLTVMWYNNGYSGSNPPAAIDNISVEESTCPGVDSVNVIDIATNSATIVGYGSVSNTYKLYYRAYGEETYDTLSIVSPYVLDNLQSGMYYEGILRSVCDDGSESFGTAVFTFGTECESISLPWSFGAECTFINGTGKEQYPYCWDVINAGVATSYSTYQWECSPAIRGAHTGNAALYFNGSSTVSHKHDDWLFTPTISFTGSEEMCFWVKSTSNSSSTNYNARFAIYASNENALDITDTANYSQLTITGAKVLNNMVDFSGSEWQQIFIKLPATLDGDHHLAFVIKNENSNSFWLDDIYLYTATSCAMPDSLKTLSVSSTDAVVSWVGNASSYTIYYGKPGFNLDTVASENTTDNSYTITGLNPNTKYEYRVVASCEDGVLSAMTTPAYFTTTCEPIASDMLPFVEDFSDNAPGINSPLDDCWFRGTNSTTVYPNIYENTYNHIGHCLQFYSSNTNYSYVALPAFEEDLSNLVLSCKILRYSVSSFTSDLVLGLMGNPYDVTTFVPYDTLSPSTLNEWSQFQVSLANYNTEDGSYLAFLLPMGQNGYSYLDNISLSLRGTCDSPTDLVVNEISSNSVTLSWTDTVASAWKLYYGHLGFNADDVTPMLLANNTTAQLTGLTPQTNYEFFVIADCGDGTFSIPSLRTPFTTACAPESVLPYIEDFESYDNGNDKEISPCWTKAVFGSTTQYPYPTSNSAINGTRSLYFESSKSTASNYSCYAALPMFEEELSNLQLRFSMRNVAGNSYTTSYSKIAMGVMTNPNDITTFDTLMIYDMSALTGGTINTYEYLFDTYTGEGKYIAFLSMEVAPQGNSSTATNKVYIDDVTVEMIPSCQRPTHLVASTTATTATLSWEGNASSYEVKYSQSADFSDSIVVTVNTNSATLTNLSSYSYYYVTVRGICSATDKSTWMLAPTKIRTAMDCGAGYENFVSTIGECRSSNNTTVLNTSTYNLNTRNWLIFTVDDLADMGLVGNANIIKSISLRTESEGGMIPFRVYMAETDADEFTQSLSDTLPLSQMTMVYDGSMTFTANSWNEILLETPFTYSDTSNLMIAFDRSANVMGSVKFYYSNLPEYKTAYTYKSRYGGGSSSRLKDRGCITFNICGDIPSCVRPRNVAMTDLSANSISYTWNGTASQYQIAYNTQDFNPNTTPVSEMLSVATTSATIQNLSPNTTYFVYMRSNCGTELSTWSGPYVVTTPCDPVDLPYFEDFDSYPASTIASQGQIINPCWVKGTDNMIQYPYVYTTHYASAPNSMNFYGNSSNFSYAALPMFNTPVNNLVTTFKLHKATDNNAIIQVGVMSDPHDIATFHAVDTLQLTSKNVWQGHEVSFANYTGNGKFIAFVAPRGGNSDIQVDDIEVFQIPSCQTPTQLEVDSITVHSALVSWHERNATTTGNYQVEYGPRGFAIGTGNRVMANSDNIHLTNLAAGAAYDVYVRTICSDTDTSRWLFPCTFFTECGPIALPVVYDFEQEAAGTNAPLPHCFTRYNDASSSYYQTYPYIDNMSRYAHSGDKYISFKMDKYDWYASTTAMIFPEIDTLAHPMNDIKVTFWAKCGASSCKAIVGVMSNPSLISTFVAIDTINLTSNYVEYTVPFNSYSGNGSYVAIKMDRSTETLNAYIDDVIIEPIAACPRVYDLHAISANNTSATIAWTDTIGSSQWIVDYHAQGSDSILSVSANTNPFTLTGLTATTQYLFNVRPICESGDTSAAVREDATFWTSQVPATLPYNYDFEEANEWSNWQTNSNCDINWYRGTAIATQGSNAIYISADQGATYGSNWNQVVNAVAYRDIDFGTDTSSFTMIFKAHAGGTIDDDLDGLAVVLANPTSGVVASNANATTPWGAATEVAISTIRRDTLWNTYRVHFENIAGVHRVALYWYNQASGADHAYIPYAGAIDSLVIKEQTCFRPTHLSISNLEANSITLHWNGTATSYEVAYGEKGQNATYQMVNGNSLDVNNFLASTDYEFSVRSICGVDDTSDWSSPKYFSTICSRYVATYTLIEDFSEVEDHIFNAPDGQLPNCWEAYTNGTNGVLPHVIGSGSYWYAHDTNSLILSAGTTEYGDTAIVRLPYTVEPVSSLILNYWMCTESNTDGTLEVGYLTSDEINGEFVAVDTIPASNDTYHGTLNGNMPDSLGFNSEVHFDSVPDNARALAFRWINASGLHSVCLDDVVVSVNITCPAPVITDSVIGHESATFTWDGSAIDYQLIYKAEEETEWSDTITVIGNTYTLTNLIPTSHYTLHLLARCGEEDGNSIWTEVEFTTHEIPCTIPTDLAASNISFESATLTWNASETATRWVVNVFNSVDNMMDTVEARSFTVSSLYANTEYQAAVKSLCSSTISSDWSDTITFTTDVCPIATNVTVSDITTHSAIVTWNSEEVLKWEINYGVDIIQGEGESSEIQERTYTITGLDENTTYDVYVRSYCTETTYSEWSELVQFTTESETPEGIDGVEGNYQFTIYPNPTHGSTTISLQGIEGQVTISVVDMNGRTITNESIECGSDCEKRIDVAGLAQGTYFVRILGDNLNSVRKLIVR